MRISAKCPASSGGLTACVGLFAACRFSDLLRWVNCKSIYKHKAKEFTFSNLFFAFNGKPLDQTFSVSHAASYVKALQKLFQSLVKTFTIQRMEKQKAIDLLGGSPKKAAECMGYTSVQAIYMWPDPLRPDVADRVRGVVARMSESLRQLAPEAEKAAA